MDKFRNKYRIASTRAPFWDYSNNAAYFITICTKNRICWFGEVIRGKMNLSTIGHIANSCWYDIPNHFPFVELGAHIIMPNHMHGIVIINKPTIQTQNIASQQQNKQTQNIASQQQNKQTQNIASQQRTKNQFGPQSKNLASIVRGFKIGVTKNARQINTNFAWQPLYHDHIIRNKISYQRISKYIINNPLKWSDDNFHK